MQTKRQALDAKLSEQLRETGFAIVPGAVPQQAVDQLSIAIEEAAAQRRDLGSHAIRHLVQTIPAARELADSPAIRALVEPILGANAFVGRSLLFDKVPGANWKVAWHQDLTIAVCEKIETPGFEAWSMKDGVVHVQPPVSVLEQMLTVRLHLDDCGESNGPLRVIPGSHNSGRLGATEISQWRERKSDIPCLVPRGGVLLMRPLLLHASSPALNPHHRRVVHLEFAAQSLPNGIRWC